MYNSTNNGFDSFAANPQIVLEEKTKIRKISNLIGAVYIILWLTPSVLSGIISTLAKIFHFEKIAGQLFSDPAFIMVYQTVFSVLVFTLPFLMLPKGSGKTVSELLGFHRPDKDLFVPFVLVGTGVSAFANVITNNIAGFLEAFGITVSSPEITYPEGIFGFLLSFIAIAVTPALVEEFATRGMVMGSVKPFGQSFALIASAAFFALMHGNLVQIPFAFMMGIVIGFAVIKTGSVLTGMVIHFINNAITVSMNYLLEEIESVILQSIISAVYFGICALLLFLGIYLAQNRCEKVWNLEKNEDALKLGEKLKLFFFSPTIIVSIALTIIECIGTVLFG